MSQTETGSIIEKIIVRKLFGTFDYDIDCDAPNLQRLTMMYGDNGSGKTKILNLIYRTLNPAANEGHRSFLAATPFEGFALHLKGGVKIELARSDDKLVVLA